MTAAAAGVAVSFSSPQLYLRPLELRIEARSSPRPPALLQHLQHAYLVLGLLLLLGFSAFFFLAFVCSLRRVRQLSPVHGEIPGSSGRQSCALRLLGTSRSAPSHWRAKTHLLCQFRHASQFPQTLMRATRLGEAIALPFQLRVHLLHLGRVKELFVPQVLVSRYHPQRYK